MYRFNYDPNKKIEITGIHPRGMRIRIKQSYKQWTLLCGFKITAWKN